MFKIQKKKGQDEKLTLYNLKIYIFMKKIYLIFRKV